MSVRSPRAHRSTRRLRSGSWLLLVSALAGSAWAGDAPEARTRPDPPLIVFAVDGLEWSVALPLLQAGEMPALRSLMERGSFGKLETLRPTLSPVVWTTVATGKLPERHGIHGFLRAGRKPGTRRLNTSRQRTTKAIWNVFSDAGLEVHSVGWWMTFPVEPVRGTMVAQTNTRAEIDTRYGRGVWKGGVLKDRLGQVYPPELHEGLMTLVGEVEAELPALARAAFGELSSPPSELGRRLWKNTLWSFRADNIYLRFAKSLLARGDRFDLLLVYFGLPDVVGHRFWRYMVPGEFSNPPRPAALANFSDVILDAYRWVDAAIGAVADAAPEGASFFVVSDHGMHVVNLDAEFPPDAPPIDVNSGGHEDAPPGVIVAAGRHLCRSALAERGVAGLRPEDLPTLGAVADLTPTLLALERLPVGEDMDGRVLEVLFEQGFLARHPVARIASHDTPGWREALAAKAPVARHTDESEAERLEQLRALGYIE